MRAALQAAFRTALVIVVAVSAACTVHGTDVPTLTGPSETALAMTLTVTPDSILHDGTSQASITVTAFDATGKGKSGQTFRLDTQVLTPSGGWALQDYGRLSLRTVTTGSDGRATASYTAPVTPGSIFANLATVVRIVATPIGNDFVQANSRSAELQLVPPAGYQAPGTNPTPSFYVSPTPVIVNVPANFVASASCPEAQAEDEPCNSALTITEFVWNFGDGTGGTGYVVAHAFPAAGTYTVTLRVVNSRGLQAVLSKEVEVVAPEPPTAAFVVTPTPARVGVPVNFNAATSKAGAGRTIVQYTWAFGTGAGGSGQTTQYTYPAVGTYNVVLTVVDDAGIQGTATVAVVVTP